MWDYFIATAREAEQFAILAEDPPELIETIAESLEPHPLPYYAMDLATAFHDFYEKCRVLSDDAGLTGARLKLVAAAKIVLARSLDLMGMSAPERM